MQARRLLVLGATWLAVAACGGGGGTAGGGGGGGGGTGGGSSAAGAFNVDQPVETSTPQLVRDGAGTLHALAASGAADAQGRLLVRYGRCSSGCEAAGGWTFATLDDSGASASDVKLAVDADQRLHIVELLGGTAPFVRYARCASGCSSPSAWSAVDVSIPATLTAEGLPRGRALAVTASGGPRLLLRGRSGAGPHLLLLACDGACVDGTGWRIDPLFYGDVGAAAIVVAGESAQVVASADPGFQLVYSECASQCGDAGRWTSAPVLSGNPYALGLARSASGEIHLAFASSMGGADRIVYARCAGQCLESRSWAAAELADGALGRGGLDLALSDGGAIAIAGSTVGRDVQAVHWLHCAQDCGQAAGWSGAQLESGTDVRDAHPSASGAACDASQTLRWWAVGDRVQIVPAGIGRWLLGYDAVSYAQCKSSPTSFASGRFLRLRSQPSP
jgi:hypothetical protein